MLLVILSMISLAHAQDYSQPIQALPESGYGGMPASQSLDATTESSQARIYREYQERTRQVKCRTVYSREISGNLVAKSICN